MNLLFANEPPFIDNAGSHAGRYRGVADGMKCWEVKNPSIDPFKKIIATVALRLSECGIPRSALVLFDLFLQGTDLGSVSVYVRIAGATEKSRKKAVRHLKKGDLLRTYPGLKVAHWDWPPDAPNVTTMGREDLQPGGRTVYYKHSRFEVLQGHSAAYFDSTNRHIIVAIADGGDRQNGVLSHLVEVGGHQYLVAPAHIFLPPPPNDTEEDAGTDDSESDTDFDMLRAGSATPPELQSRSVSEGTVDEAPQRSPSDGVEEADQSLVRHTVHSQDFYVFCTELDYVLIQIPLLQAQALNLRLLAEGTARPVDHRQTEVTVETLSHPKMDAISHGRPTMMRLPHSNSFSTVYPLELSIPVTKGDCGSAVFGRGTSDLVGFIVAGSIEGRVGYMVSAADMLEDMKRRIRITVPPRASSGNQVSRLSSLSVPQSPSTPALGMATGDLRGIIGLNEARIRYLPSATTDDSAKLLLLWCREVASIQVIPAELSGDPGCATAVVSFKSPRGPVEVRRMLHGKVAGTGSALRVDIANSLLNQNQEQPSLSGTTKRPRPNTLSASAPPLYRRPSVPLVQKETSKSESRVVPLNYRAARAPSRALCIGNLPSYDTEFIEDKIQLIFYRADGYLSTRMFPSTAGTFSCVVAFSDVSTAQAAHARLSSNAFFRAFDQIEVTFATALEINQAPAPITLEKD